jgi:hypothetical protein
MHPSDVEQYVAESVAVLRDRVAARRDLNVVEVALVTPTDLHVRFVRSNVGVSGPGLLRDPVSGRTYLQPTVLPDLSRRRQEELVLHCDLVDYDSQPPTADLLDAQLRPLPAGRWPRDLFGGRGVDPRHPTYGRPFFCRPGLREFHEHFHHEDDPWDLYREGLALHETVIGLLGDFKERWRLSQ